MVDTNKPSRLEASSEAAIRRPEIRRATLGDLDGLVALEERCFREDRILRRQFRYLLTKAHAGLWVAEDRAALLGSLVLLFRRGRATARLYSIAVAPESRGLGVARALVEVAEREAWARERQWMRLEIRKDNEASMRLFEGMGYRRFGAHAGYYADEMDAWRYEKRLQLGGVPSTEGRFASRSRSADRGQRT
jgi:ribosomal protein S18 acetylase RimI-like enzyme